jgi:hypothetical protein
VERDGRVREVAKSGEIALGEARAVEGRGGKRIALIKVDRTFQAIDDSCTQRAGLSEGMVQGQKCPAPGTAPSSTSQAERCWARLHCETSPI